MESKVGGRKSKGEETRCASRLPRYSKLWIGIAILIILSPLGLLIPELFKAGGSWGEWGADEIREMIGYAPEGLKKLSERWSAPFPDYTLFGQEKGVKSYVSYILSGLIGVALVVAAAYLFGRILTRINLEKDKISSRKVAKRAK